ncbi:MAG: hypothetical protein ACTSP1_20000 [Candidatus Freyarchaeota archaeon]
MFRSEFPVDTSQMSMHERWEWIEEEMRRHERMHLEQQMRLSDAGKWRTVYEVGGQREENDGRSQNVTNR